MIYDIRPAACRYTYATSNPQLCSPPLGKPATIVDTSALHRLVAAESAELAREAGLPIIVAPLQVLIVMLSELTL